MKRHCPRPRLDADHPADHRTGRRTDHRVERSKNRRVRTDLALCFVKVARSATERALRLSLCPDLFHLISCAHDNLAAAHDLIVTDRKWAA